MDTIATGVLRVGRLVGSGWFCWLFWITLIPPTFTHLMKGFTPSSMMAAPSSHITSSSTPLDSSSSDILAVFWGVGALIDYQNSHLGWIQRVVGTESDATHKTHKHNE